MPAVMFGYEANGFPHPANSEFKAFGAAEVGTCLWTWYSRQPRTGLSKRTCTSQASYTCTWMNETVKHCLTMCILRMYIYIY